MYDLDNITQRVAKQTLVSGTWPSPTTVGASYQRSPFMTALLEALQDEQADTNDDCYAIMPEIMDYLHRKGFQTLTLSELPLHDSGEFVFRVARTLTPQQIEARLGDTTRSLCGLNLQEWDLRERNLSGRDLREAKLSHADLRRAILNRADLRWAQLAKANLSDASLQQARLSQADLEEAKLAGADLREANLSQAYLHKVNLQQAKLQQARLFDVKLLEADLIEADLSDAKLDLADLSKAWLKDAKLNNAQLGRVNLDEALLRETDLSQADLRDADVNDMRFEPKARTLPKLEYMQQAQHLDKMTCDISSCALTELRYAFQQASMYTAAQQVASAIKRCEKKLGQ